MPPPLSLLGGDIPTTSNLMARYAAVLDACALVPIVLADTLLRIAELGLKQAKRDGPPLGGAVVVPEGSH